MHVGADVHAVARPPGGVEQQPVIRLRGAVIILRQEPYVLRFGGIGSAEQATLFFVLLAIRRQGRAARVPVSHRWCAGDWLGSIQLDRR